MNEFQLFLALETVIYFEDKSGLILRVEDGQNAEAGELPHLQDTTILQPWHSFVLWMENPQSLFYWF